MTNLNNINSLLSRDERNKLNENWQLLTQRFSHFQRHLNLLAGEDVEGIITNINERIAETDAALQQIEIDLVEVNGAADNANAKAELAQTAADIAEQITALAQEKIDFIETHEEDIEFFTSMQNNLQAQVDQLVISGDSSPEAAQARVGVDGTQHNTLKARLDSEIGQVTTQLDDTANDLHSRGLNIKSILDSSLTPVIGDGVTDDTLAIQRIIDYAYTNSLEIVVPYGTYRTKSLVLKVNMRGFNATFLFDNGHRFTNYESDGSKLYSFTELKGITFESDKSTHWNSTEAGESYASGITKKDVIRLYGQRVYIGNKTTTPNNILATDTQQQLNGIGFWNKFYNQWTGTTGVDLNDITISYNAISNKEDTNIIAKQYKFNLEDCAFIGFTSGLSILGCTNFTVYNCDFIRCKIGVLTEHAGSLPSPLTSSSSKSTTVTIEKSLFEDISFVGVYGSSFLQSRVKDSIFQPCKIGVALIYGAHNDIFENYFEICSIGVYVGSNSANGNIINSNFSNSAYSLWSAYLKYGLNNKVSNCRSNLAVFAHASIKNNDFDSSCVLTKDDDIFYANGNSIERNKTKMSTFNTTGVNGTGITSQMLKTTRTDGTIPKITISQTGLKFEGTEEILAVELMSHNGKLSYYEASVNGNPKVLYIDIWDNVNKSFARKDIREQGVIYTFKVVFNDGTV